MNQIEVSKLKKALLEKRDMLQEISAMFREVKELERGIVDMARGKYKRVHDAEVSQLVADIVDIVCKEFAVPFLSISSASRVASVSEARSVICYLLRRYLAMGVEEVGRVCGVTHGAVTIACERVEERIETEVQFKAKVIKLESELLKHDLMSASTIFKGPKGN